jgi:glutamate formiminotransferase
VTLLAVPNISEGRDAALVARIAGTDAILDISSDIDHNRSVLTYGGSPEPLLDALVGMVDRAVASLDIRTHHGVHPRFGVVDVLPIVPWDAATDDDARALITELSWRVAQGPGVTFFPYGRAAADGRSLPELRRLLPTHPEPQHSSAGVICVGIRDPLIAFNVNIDAPVDVARRIAGEIRTDEVRTLGFALPSRGLSQVSMNLLEPRSSGPRAAFVDVAARTDRIVDAEVVGLVPAAVLTQFADLPMRDQVRSIEDALSG